MAKFSQKEVRYQNKPSGKDSCRGCRHFLPPDACQGVAGVISPDGYCVRFDAKPRGAKWYDKQKD